MADARRPRILVTRSEPGASETARRLAALGYEPVVEPLFAIVAVDAALPAFDALAFTSANGVRAFAKLSARRDAAVFCVGGRTAETAREAGFADVASADGDVDALVDVIAAQLPASRRLLHAGNEDAVGDLAARLKAKGVDAAFVALFRAEPVAAPGSALSRHLNGETAFDAVLIHSPRGADVLAQFVSAADAPAPLAVAAISRKAMAPLASLAQRAEVAAHPDEDALLAALKRIA